MKKILALSCTVLLCSLSNAQIPVTDVASIQQQVSSQIETIAKWQSQYEQMTTRIDQAKQQYESITGSRGLGEVFNDPSMRDYLPAEWQSVYDSVKRGGYSGLSGKSAQIYNQNKVFDSCERLRDESQKRVCESRAVKSSQDQALALESFDKAKDRINQIDRLMRKINDTTDPKSIAELQSRIAIEQANIQNEQTKLQLYRMIADSESKIQEQQHREIQARTWAADKPIKARPLSF